MRSGICSETTNFNPRSREGSDGCSTVSNIPSSLFQSTLPRRERPCCPPYSSTSNDFNPRSREGSDGRCGEGRGRCREFQSTLPRRERQYNPEIRTEQITFQSTLPRRERPRVTYVLKIRQAISIHAPAKGATLVLVASAPSKEFQSTLPRRERQTSANFPDPLDTISIHAPAKGATDSAHNLRFVHMISIHAPAKGATRVAGQGIQY